MKGCVLGYVVLAATLLLPSFAVANDFTGKVVGIIDGDSIRVMHEGKAEQFDSVALIALRRGRHSAKGRSRPPLPFPSARR